MGIYIANAVIKLMSKNELPIHKAKVLVLGITFKENCPDIRNSRAVDVINELKSFGTDVDIFDPHADEKEVRHEYNLALVSEPRQIYDAIILTVSHKEFVSLNWTSLKHNKTVVYDVKGILDKSLITARL
jgi:UDP-N-acetyl-D-glucosamine/UDP-N-acetyl-D-galactosamine dehydrogenase